MTINEYQQAALRTANEELDNIGQLTNGLIGLNGEAGEAIDILKKHLFQGHELDKEHMAKELGDCLWMIAEICSAIGITMDEVMQMNIDKLKARYPQGFEAEKSLHRAEGDI